MENKKTIKKDLEKYRLIFFETGMIFALLIILTAFEWSSKPALDAMSSIGKGNSFEPDMSMMSTIREEEKQIPKRPPVIEIINIYDNDDPVISNKDFPDFDFRGNDPDYTNWMIPDMPKEEINDPIDFIDVHEKPMFMGENPETSFRKYIARQVVYPEEAIENGVQGMVVLQFIVDKKGKISHVEILGSAHPVLDKEAIRVLVSSSSLWSPGKQRGIPVNVIYRFPVVFKISY